MHISVLAVFSYAGCRQACVTGRMRRGSRACHARRAWRRSAAALPLAHSAPLRGRGTHRAGIACGVRMSGLDWMKLDEFSSGISPMSGWMNSPLLGEIIHPSNPHPPVRLHAYRAREHRYAFSASMYSPHQFISSRRASMRSSRLA